MSIAKKYRICQGMFALSFVAVLYSISHMSPFEPTHSNLHWFIVLSVSAAFGVGFGLGFYYYRAKLREDPIDTIRVEALANAGRVVKEDSLRKK